MRRSASKIFTIALVPGAAAFFWMLVFGPVPGRSGAERSLSPYQTAQIETRAAIRDHATGRGQMLVDERWDQLEASAAAALTEFPDSLWAWSWPDLLYAVSRDPGRAGEARLIAREMRGPATLTLGTRTEWRGRAALGWSSWALGDEAEARREWDLAARMLEHDTQLSPISVAYNRAGYRSLAGDVDAGIASWREAVELGYGNFPYARVDYDMRELWGDPRFEAVIQEALAAQRQQFGPSGTR